MKGSPFYVWKFAMIPYKLVVFTIVSHKEKGATRNQTYDSHCTLLLLSDLT